jgi:uncharacterized membrane protein
MPCRVVSSDTYHLWPHRSLSPRGFVWFIGTTAALLLVPLLSQLGRLSLWVLLPFLLGAVAAIWTALRRSSRTDSEVLTLTPSEIHLFRHRPGQPDTEFRANPHWMRLEIHPTGGPVPDYLTLTGNGRSVELGAFLTQAERRQLHAHLADRLAALRAPGPDTGIPQSRGGLATRHPLEDTPAGRDES